MGTQASAPGRDTRQRMATAAGAALRASEARFRQMAEAIDQIFFLVKPDQSQVLYVSPAYERIFGAPVETCYRNPRAWLEAIHPEDRPAMAAKVAAGPTAISESRYRIIRPDGAVRWIRSRVFPIVDADGRVYRLAGVAEDVTALHEAEAAARQSETRIRTLLESVPDVLWTSNAHGGTTYISPNVVRVYGFTAEEIRADGERLWIGRIHPDDLGRVLASYQALFAQGTPYDVEYRIQRRDGTWMWVHDRSTATQMIDGVEYAHGLFSDVTARHTAEAALAASQAQLRQSQKIEAIGRLAGGVAHDFNNLLTGIIGYADLGIRRLPEGDRLRVDLEEIRRAGERAADLTRQLLAFSRKQVMQPRILDLGCLVADMEKLLRRVIGEDIDLVLVRSDAGTRVRADPGQLEQVLMNLAVNARDAMPTGGRLEIRVEALRVAAPPRPDLAPGAFVRITVADTGLGMSEDVLAHLFEPFFTTKEPGKGTGLGLSTVYGIVEQSGGHVTVQSAPGRGTTFEILLPRIVEGAAEPGGRPPTRELPRGTGTILLAEDEAGLRALAVRVLTEAGYRVHAAEDGAAALALAAGCGPIDLLVTDVVMPRLCGPKLAEALGAARPGLPVLFLSGYAEERIVHGGIVDPGVRLLGKPFDPEALLGAVREALGR